MDMTTYDVILLFMIFVMFPLVVKIYRKLFKGFQFYFITLATFAFMGYFIYYIDPMMH